MAKFNTDTLSLFHTFSKTQVNSDANKPQFSSLGNTVNKSGHTVQSNEIWTEAIPFFGLGVPADFSSTAQVNDLVKDADGVIWQRNATPYTDANGTYWTQKTKSITSFTKGTDGKYTFTEEDGALVDGSYLLNAAGVPTVKYHAKKQLTPLVSDNNAFIDSEKDASRLKIDGKWVDQFIGVTDVYVNGSAAVSYAPVLFSTSTATSPLKAGAGEDYLDYCATGIILWDKNDCTGNEVISCFEYVGAKLDATVAKLSAAVFGSGSTGDEDLSLSEQVTANTTAINVLKGADTVDGSIAKSIKTAIENLGDVAVKSDITITDIKVKVGNGTATSLTPNNKSVTIEIPDAPEAVVTAEGTVTTDGFTKTAAVTSLANAAINAAITGTDGAIADAIDSAISDATLADGQKIATTTDTSKLVTVEDVTTYVSENAKVTLTQGTGITVTPNGEASTSFTVAVDDTVATKKSVDDLSSLVSGLPATIQAAHDAADEAKGIAETAVQSVKVNGTEAKSGTTVSITALTSVDASATGSNGITIGETNKKVTLSVTPATYSSSTKSWSNNTNFAKASDIATAISDAVNAITIPSVTTSDAAKAVGVTASGHEVSVTTAEYTASTDSWTKKDYLITGATVEAFVNDVVSEVSSDLTALENKVNAYHEAGVSYAIYDKAATKSELPDLSVPANVEKYKNVILLVPTTSRDTDDKIEAITGGYVEWLCVNKGTKDAPSWDWEQIGTTAADLHGYVNWIDSEQAATLANQKSVYASISSTGYLTLGVASATDSVMGVSKMFSGNYWQLPSTATDTAVSTATASQMFNNINAILEDKANANDVVSSINGAKGTVNLCVHNYYGQDDSGEGNIADGGTQVSNHANLWGMTFITNSSDRDIILVDDFVGASDSYLTTANLPSYAVRVENNFVIAEGRGNEYVVTSIRPERMVSGFDATYATGLTSFVGDLSNLETAQVENSYSTFYSMTALNTFIGDLSSLKNGSGMFNGCISLATFIGDLSSLESGGNNDSHHLSGGMFGFTNLTVESVENIADTLPENPVVDIDATKGTIGISWHQLTSDTAERQKLVDALSGVVDKGWVLYTNSELLTMFDTEKYKVVQYTVQPLDLDSEPQTVYYVVKK